MPMNNPPHPGEALREDVMPDLDMTAAELAKHLGYSLEQLSSVLSCRAPITADLAILLEAAGIGAAHIYLAEQSAYDLWQSRNRS
ncbi:HigA family addiction module antitoxin [Pseudomonas sp. MS19]|uniref:HigA family addiction module antitoxin n=1 Tax=Pseudomonas sp. MS19 TaxID=2579939 RepID=UPI001562869D|nr:HigA family addiction module antitoxin [Pseudomonas sp. MS19]NRH29977.1 HigA family addiction module antidote protein [Pseudomonas sp. MS19]